MRSGPASQMTSGVIGCRTAGVWRTPGVVPQHTRSLCSDAEPREAMEYDVVIVGYALCARVGARGALLAGH